MKVTQRFPNFFSGFTSEKAEVATVEELHAIPFVKRWMDNEKFYRLSISRDHHPQAILMCELDGGKEFWAIAFLTEHENFEFPRWKD